MDVTSDKNIYKVMVHGVGYKQNSLSPDDTLGFYTTFGLEATNVNDLKGKLPSLIKVRMTNHNVLNSNKTSNFEVLIIEGIYHGNRSDLEVDGFTFYKANFLSRFSFSLKCIYLNIFDSVRILKICHM